MLNLLIIVLMNDISVKVLCYFVFVLSSIVEFVDSFCDFVDEVDDLWWWRWE